MKRYSHYWKIIDQTFIMPNGYRQSHTNIFSVQAEFFRKEEAQFQPGNL